MIPTNHHGLCIAGQGEDLAGGAVEQLGAARLPHHAHRLHPLLVWQAHHYLDRREVGIQAVRR